MDAFERRARAAREPAPENARWLRIGSGPDVLVDASEYDRCRRHYFQWSNGGIHTLIGREHVTLGRFLTGYTGRSRVMLVDRRDDYRLSNLRIGPGGTITKRGARFQVYTGSVFCGSYLKEWRAVQAAEDAREVLASLPRGTSAAKRKKYVRLAVGLDTP